MTWSQTSVTHRTASGWSGAPTGIWWGTRGAVPAGTRAALAIVSKMLGTAVLAGVAVGCAWAALAPKVVQIVGDPASVDAVTGAGLSDPTMQVGLFFVGEVYFAGLTVLAGLLLAVLARRHLQRGSVAVVLVLAVGGLLGSLIAWRVGVWLGPGAVDPATLAIGDEVARPLRLRSSGLLLVWALASVLVAFWSLVLEPTSPPHPARPTSPVDGAASA